MAINYITYDFPPVRQVISLASAISACGRWEHSILLSEELGSSGLQANLMLSLTLTLLQTLLTLLEPLRNAQTGSNNCGVRSKWPIRGYLQMLRSVHARNKVGPELCLSLSHGMSSVFRIETILSTGQWWQAMQMLTATLWLGLQACTTAIPTILCPQSTVFVLMQDTS